MPLKKTMDLDFDIKELLNIDETLISLQKAGEGNMNLVFRARTNQRSFIIKQAKPYVVKYPSIPAPIDRIETEYMFYQAIEKSPFLRERSPKIINFIAGKQLLLMEDLGEIEDYSKIYKEPIIEEPTIIELLAYLSNLHQISGVEFPENLAMRKLNHEHIFQVPFEERNGIDLDKIQPGLQKLARKVQQNQNLKDTVLTLGKRYMQNSTTLIHGDFYPGSWMMGKSSLKIIDPEFAFAGDPEFDLGIMAAHLRLADTDIDGYTMMQRYYTNPLRMDVIKQWEGVEIIRRLIGVAQLPLQKSLKAKKDLLTHATKQIMQK